MIDPVKAHGDADHHRHHGQGIKEGRQKGGGYAEGQRQHCLGGNTQQQAGKDKQQQLLHKVDPGHHKHQQQEHFQI